MLKKINQKVVLVKIYGLFKLEVIEMLSIFSNIIINQYN